MSQVRAGSGRTWPVAVASTVRSRAATRSRRFTVATQVREPIASACVPSADRVHPPVVSAASTQVRWALQEGVEIGHPAQLPQRLGVDDAAPPGRRLDLGMAAAPIRRVR